MYLGIKNVPLTKELTPPVFICLTQSTGFGHFTIVVIQIMCLLFVSDVFGEDQFKHCLNVKDVYLFVLWLYEQNYRNC